MREISSKTWEFDVAGMTLTVSDEAVAQELHRWQCAEADRYLLAAALREVLPFATHRIQQMINEDPFGRLSPEVLYGYLDKAKAALDGVEKP